METTIEQAKDGNGFSVYEWSTYPRHSVLAGQDQKRYIAHCDTLAEAKMSHPNATEGYRDACNTFDHLSDEGDY